MGDDRFLTLDEYVGSLQSMDESRVTLRGFTTDDLPEFLEWATDDEVTRFLMWDSYTSADDALNYLKNTAVPHPWLKAICVDGKAAGSIVVDRRAGFTVRGAAAGSANAALNVCRGVLGYCVARKFWGQGVATIAVRKMVAMAFQGMPGVVRVEALVNQRNGASRRVLEKAGFQLEGAMAKYQLVKGELRDCFLFATYAPPHHPSAAQSSQKSTNQSGHT